MDSPTKFLPGLPVVPEKDDIQPLLVAYGLEYTPDGKYIRWSASNKKHPRNWSATRKAFDSSVIVFLDLFTYAHIHHCNAGKATTDRRTTELELALPV